MNRNRFIVARARGQAAKAKTAGMQLSLFLPPFFPQRDAGAKGWLNNKARKPASGNRGTTAFFGEPNALLPGHGTPVPEGKFFVLRTHLKHAFFRREIASLLNQIGDDLKRKIPTKK